jgi:APA family basic amino acid/polyamine antiporter
VASPSLQRRLGLGDAVFIGLGSMVGAGVFAVWGPAADAAGTGLLVGLAIAALVAFGNATSSAQLAAAHPTSGGTYAYGRAELGPWWGFVAGWGFIIGKTASCAAMALTFAAYAAPSGWERPVAIGAVVVLTAVNWFGVTRTASAARVIVVISLGALAAAVTAAFSAGPAPEWLSAESLWSGGAYGILQSAGLLFFAFAGYARVATLGEEVREPARTIPRAIAISLGIVVVVYAVIGTILLASLGAPSLAVSDAPLARVVVLAGWAWAEPVVQLGAAIAALGALLALIAGIGRTSLAMARDGELPHPLTRVHPRFGVPHVAELTVGLAVIVLVLVADLRGAIGFSSFGVLLYYLVANWSALTQPAAERLVPRWLSWAGAIGCVVLVVTLPPVSIVAGVAVFAVGAAVRGIRLTVARRRA